MGSFYSPHNPFFLLKTRGQNIFSVEGSFYGSSFKVGHQWLTILHFKPIFKEEISYVLKKNRSSFLDGLQYSKFIRCDVVSPVIDSFNQSFLEDLKIADFISRD